MGGGLDGNGRGGAHLEVGANALGIGTLVENDEASLKAVANEHLGGRLAVLLRDRHHVGLLEH